MILGFWGLTIFPERTYTQIVDDSFKLSMAALDEETTPGRTSVRVSVNNDTFILCSLIAGQIEQQTLDLVFTEGEEISFSVSGPNAVHLSGNYLPDDHGGMDYSEDEDMYGMDLDDSDDDEDDEDEDDDDLIITPGAKQLAYIGDEDEDEDSDEDPDFTDEDDEDEDEDEDDDEEDSDEDMEGRSNENDDDDDDDDEEDEDDEDEEGDSEEEEEEEEDTPVKAAVEVKKEQSKKEQPKVAEIKKEQQPKKEVEAKKEQPKKDNIKTLPNGLIIEDKKVGDGARAKSGKKIGMRYIGRLTNGKVFDKNTSGKPFNFTLGSGEVIKGWDLGIQGMQLGGERKLTIPPSLAYGASGAPPDIPRNATLEFEVKLVTLK